LMNNDLNERQKRFADYYIENPVLIDAYKNAGYAVKNPNVAYTSASKLLRIPKVKSYIDSRLKKQDDARIASAEEVLQYLTKVVRGELKEETVAVENVGDFKSKARIVEKQVTPKDRNKAAELLAKRYGLLIDNVKINEDKPNIIDNIK
jgi:phage terminase small subunit